MIKFLLSFALLAGSMAYASPQGVVHVIDADTIEVDGQRVRLFGIDAPEVGQPCVMSGRSADCGRWARDRVVDRFAGAQAICIQVDVDRFGRIVATCQVGDEDMSAVIVRSGWAWAYMRYSDAYALEEKSAALDGLGLWQFEVQRPEDYRATLARG
ncbi:thermonuclease family protein [Yoonia sediminilitoris]|uniref:Endonuclease YncB(Thermonuclease family) n=1 Tax=Yoonia sediminilitoris TaxID=1286148 RepID=A0A2T6KQ57_9RHOB|nr:thermonuclease family protein [Yoonia sediminilitoris]PUB18665.1 endonuclease YncB(thermonuclease family) [Yoonia sediminilitoris]RCW98833.1 endonuclease YncB(thermonuclease family) [Yoonia sediminilitoris]